MNTETQNYDTMYAGKWGSIFHYVMSMVRDNPGITGPEIASRRPEGMCAATSKPLITAFRRGWLDRVPVKTETGKRTYAYTLRPRRMSKRWRERLGIVSATEAKAIASEAKQTLAEVKQPDLFTSRGWSEQAVGGITDDAPEWTQEDFDRAELRVGDRVIRPATGTLTGANTPTQPVDNGAPQAQAGVKIEGMIVLTVGGKSYDLSLFEARSVYDNLAAVFGR